MKKLNKILFITVLTFSFLISASNVFAVDTPSILKKCDNVVKETACRNAVKKCETDACANKAVVNKAITGGLVIDICRNVDKPQACNSAYIDKCKQFTGNRDEMKKCKDSITEQYGKASGSANADNSTSAAGLPGDAVNLNSQGAKDAEKSDIYCGSGTSKVHTQIDLGCLGEKGKLGAIEDLALALVRLLTYGVGIVLVGSMIYAGIMYSASQGNPETTSKSKNRIRDAVVALIFYLLIGALMQFLVPGGFFG